jgi:nitrate reductase delta subunit
MPETRQLLACLSRLVSYPCDGYMTDVEACAVGLSRIDPAVGAAFQPFADLLRGLSTEARQEIYTHTFDLNPVCALDVGWHLYGEQYERGAFMVRMRQALARHGIVENGELPDHLSHLLLLTSRLDDAEAAELVPDSLLPAIDKMLASLEKAETPFRALVATVRSVLVAHAAAMAEVHRA